MADHPNTSALVQDLECIVEQVSIASILPESNEARNTNCDLQLPGNRTDLYVLARELISEVDDLTNLRKHCIGDVSPLDDIINILIKCVTA